MTRILLSAYSCEPAKGSEPGAGYALARAASEVGPCWVLTRANNVESLESALNADPTRHPVTVVGVDGPSWSLALKRRLRAVRTYYSLWQRVALRRAEDLDREVGGFDVVHHATMSAFWMPIGVSRLRRPLVVGPISGGTFTPRPLLRYLGVRGLIEDTVRFGAAHVGSWRARRRLRSASVIVVQNREMEDFARRRLSLGRDRLMRHSHAAHPELPTLNDAPHRERTVLFVGRVVTWKGVLLAIDAFAAAGLRDCQLVVIGQGPALETMRRRADAAGIGGQVVFTGPLDRDEVLDRMRSASCLLFPSFHDSAGFVVSEALSLGLPVVCLDHGGPGELVRLWDGTESRAIRPERADRTVRALAAAISEFVDTPREVPTELAMSNSSLTDLLRVAYTRATGGQWE